MSDSYKETQKADLVICLGSSLRVSPHCAVMAAKENKNLVIVNLQITPYDKNSTIRIFGKTDDVHGMEPNDVHVMKHLKLDFPEFKIEKQVKLGISKNGSILFNVLIEMVVMLLGLRILKSMDKL